MEDIEKYLEKTGQTFQELMAGNEAYGTKFIQQLVQQALAENKMIIWQDDPDKGIGAMRYTLEKV